MKRVLAILSMAVLLISCSSDEVAEEISVRPIPSARVADFSDLERRNFPGRARAAQELDLSFRVTGPLITFPVLVGQRVSVGDILARIDPRDFEVRLQNAEGQLERAKANLDRADSEYKRLQGIRKKDPQLVSEVHLERAREAFELASADTKALAATVDAARDELTYTYLKAPFDGTVVATGVENFESVLAGQSILRLLNNRRIEFVFQVPETLIAMIPHVEEIQVRFDAIPDIAVMATVSEIGTEASSLTRTYPVTVSMDQPEAAEVLPGMAGRVTGIARLPGSEGKINIVIPVAAVYAGADGKESQVWVIDESKNTVNRRGVQLGNLVNGGVSVESGLRVGEAIATAGVNFLTEGQLVRPVFE